MNDVELAALREVADKALDAAMAHVDADTPANTHALCSIAASLREIAAYTREHAESREAHRF